MRGLAHQRRTRSARTALAVLVKRIPFADLPKLAEAYLNGESLQLLAAPYGVSRQAMYNRLRAFTHCGQFDTNFSDLVTMTLVNRIAEADWALEEATNLVDIARARDLARFSRMDFERRNEAKRFIMLIDALYDSHVKLLASAEAEAPDLYRADTGREAFEFDRTVSRLIEMRSEDYLSLPHGRVDSADSGQSTGLVET